MAAYLTETGRYSQMAAYIGLSCCASSNEITNVVDGAYPTLFIISSFWLYVSVSEISQFGLFDCLPYCMQCVFIVMHVNFTMQEEISWEGISITTLDDYFTADILLVVMPRL